MKRLLTLTLCAILLLCSCGGNSTTTSTQAPETEETTLPVTETTVETTAVTTTAKQSTTTTATVIEKVTTQSVQTTKGSNFAPESEIFLFDCSFKWMTPFEEEQLEMLENIFYGEWKADGKYEDKNLTYQNCYFDFAGFCSPSCFIETDEGYVLPYVSGGVLQCFFIKKSNISVMYDEYYDFGINGITIDEDTWKYHKSTEFCSKDISPGKLSSLGQIKLNSIIGGNFKECLNDKLNDSCAYIDSNGTEWIYSSGVMGIPPEERYLISYSENKVELAIRHFKKSEYYAYIDGDYSVKPEEQHFILTFEKINGEWKYSNTRQY